MRASILSAFSALSACAALLVASPCPASARIPAVDRTGFWRVLGQAPNGRVLPYDLGRIEEEAALLPEGKHAALYALGADSRDFHPERDPVVLVHGLLGQPAELQPVVDHLYRRLTELGLESRYQFYFLAYADYHVRTRENGRAFAAELHGLSMRLGRRSRLTIIAHSLGGIVTRCALNMMSLRSLAAEYAWIRALAIDTPWHGYPGPSDRGVGKALMEAARPFIPDGFEDMRAESSMFIGDGQGHDRSAHSGLLRIELPEHVEIKLVFAQDGAEVMDYSEGLLRQLAPLLAAHYRDEKPVVGEPRLMNFYYALLSSQQYFGLQDELRSIADRRRLTADTVRQALERRYPRFPGNHQTVLYEHPGQYSLLDYLIEELSRSA